MKKTDAQTTHQNTCSRCGNTLEADARFCNDCGKDSTKESTAPSNIYAAAALLSENELKEEPTAKPRPKQSAKRKLTISEQIGLVAIVIVTVIVISGTMSTRVTYLTTDPANVSFSYSGGSENIHVQTDGDFINIESKPSWCPLITKNYGQIFELICDPNTGNTVRVDSLVLSSGGWFNNAFSGKKVRSVSIIQGVKATYIRATPNNASFDHNNWTGTINVETDGGFWNIKELPNWCSVSPQSGSGGSFKLTCEANTGSSRSASFSVQADDITAKVTVSQRGALSTTKLDWGNAMRRLTESYTYKWDSGDKYKGSLNDGGAIYSWSDGGYYIGRFSNNKRNGLGMYLASDGNQINNTPNCAIYVGNWVNDDKSGQGKCYDRFGNLLYSGTFRNNSPVDAYPSTTDLTMYRLAVGTGGKDNTWIYEMKNGESHGHALLITNDNAAVLGRQENGGWEGECLYISSDGARWEIQSCRAGNCSLIRSSSGR